MSPGVFVTHVPGTYLTPPSPLRGEGVALSVFARFRHNAARRYHVEIRWRVGFDMVTAYVKLEVLGTSKAYLRAARHSNS